MIDAQGKSKRGAIDAPIDPIEVRLFLEAIFERYGYDLRDYAAPSIRRRVQATLARSGVYDLSTLQRRVLADAGLFARVLSGLTVQVTALFRDPGFYRALRRNVVPLLRTYPFVNIWHAGCATGEEAYSTAVLLEEEGLLARCQLYATDLSASAIERAKQGVFAAPECASLEDAHRRAGGSRPLSAHATFAYDQVAFKESLRSKILFFQHNLVSDHTFAEMHVIFCRNVLIYFGRSLRARVLTAFAANLCRGGFLCLGASERLTNEARGSFTEVAGDERIYQLRGSA